MNGFRARPGGVEVLLCLVLLLTVSTSAATAPRPFAARHKIEIEGLLMLDVADVGGLYTDGGHSREADVRRARMGISGDFNKNISASVTLDLDSDDAAVDLHEALLQYEPSKTTRLELGLIKQPFGLENNASSRKLDTLERSMATNAFAPNRGHGLIWSAEPANHHVALGVFADPDITNVYELSGRSTLAPVKDKNTVLHFGINGAYRDNKLSDYRIRDSGVLQDGDNFFKSGRYNPDHITTLGLEALWLLNSVSVQTEWFKQSLALPDNAVAIDPSFSGGYIKLGVILKNGRRKYSNGKLGKVVRGKQGRPIELVASIGKLNTVFADKGDDATEISLGANYIINDNIKIAGQAQRLSTVDADGDKDTGTSVLLRLQIDLSAKPGRGPSLDTDRRDKKSK